MGMGMDNGRGTSMDGDAGTLNVTMDSLLDRTETSCDHSRRRNARNGDGCFGRSVCGNRHSSFGSGSSTSTDTTRLGNRHMCIFSQ